MTKLERVRIMNVSLKGIALGDWRDLTEQELAVLLKSVEHSSSEAKPATAKRAKPKAQPSINRSAKKGTVKKAQKKPSRASKASIDSRGRSPRPSKKKARRR
mgnify:CR=1 FL=1